MTTPAGRAAMLAASLSLGCATEGAPADRGAPDVGPRATTGAPARPALGPAARAKLEALLADLARPPFGTGAVLCVSVGGQEVTLTAGTLWSDGPAVSEGTRFNVASVSKLLTAAKVVDLAAQGRLGLDDPLSDHLSGVRLLDRGGRDRAAEVTLRQLLMHRGGVPHQPGALDPRDSGSTWSDPGLLRLLAESWTITLAGEPGAYGYSNLGYVLLGAIVERLEGVTFAEAMDAHLRRGGLSASTFWPATLEGPVAHGRVLEDGEVRFHAPAWYGSRYALPFTGLWSSAPDLVRFGRALIAASADPAAPLHAMTRLEAEQGHGLGAVHRTRHGARSLEHDGSGPGFSAWLLAVPERDLVLAVACNGGQETRAAGQTLFQLTEAMLAVVLGE